MGILNNLKNWALTEQERYRSIARENVRSMSDRQIIHALKNPKQFEGKKIMLEALEEEAQKRHLKH